MLRPTQPRAYHDWHFKYHVSRKSVQWKPSCFKLVGNRHLAVLYGIQRYRRILIVHHVITNQTRTSRLTSKHKAHLSDRSSITSFKYTTCRSAQYCLPVWRQKQVSVADRFRTLSLKNLGIIKEEIAETAPCLPTCIFCDSHTLQHGFYGMGTLLVTTYRNFMDPDKFRNGCDNILSETWKGQLWFMAPQHRFSWMKCEGDLNKSCACRNERQKTLLTKRRLSVAVSSSAGPYKPCVVPWLTVSSAYAFSERWSAEAFPYHRLNLFYPLVLWVLSDIQFLLSKLAGPDVPAV